ncbi:MDR family MFS transporter [Streptomyces profundus]|uniref:MDR family MFS transporter n=1 Tax=Streptomyces profundus TaxID=2867410 RepID=UPI001D167FB2|nr:MFS transporter [Streptomyces sp. MA3_2.13]UED83346.1 MFS transporter [Streptomyces sp. MA3_2.13]
MPHRRTQERPTRAADLPASFWWLWFAVLVTWTGRFVVPFMTLFLTRDAGLSTSEAGMIVSGYGGGVVLSALAGGVLSDVIGRRRTLIGSLLLSAGTMLVIPSFPQPAAIAVLLFVFGLVNGAAQPAVAALITDLVPQAHRRAAFAYNFWAVNLGYAIGPLLAGFIADHAFSYLFYAQAGVLLVSASIVLARVTDSHVPTGRRRRGADPPPAPPGGLREVLRDRVFVTFVLAMLVYSVVYVQSTSSLPVAMVEDGFTSAEYGFLLTLNGVLLCALQIPSARLVARWRREAVLAGALLFTALGVGLQGFADSWILYATAVSIWTIGEMGAHPSAQSIAADMSTRQARGRYLGFYALAFSTATMIGPLVGGTVIQRWGSGWLWGGCAVACVLLAGFLTLTARPRERRLAAGAGTPGASGVSGAPGTSGTSGTSGASGGALGAGEPPGAPPPQDPTAGEGPPTEPVSRPRGGDPEPPNDPAPPRDRVDRQGR